MPAQMSLFFVWYDHNIYNGVITFGDMLVQLSAGYKPTFDQGITCKTEPWMFLGDTSKSHRSVFSLVYL